MATRDLYGIKVSPDLVSAGTNPLMGRLPRLIKRSLYLLEAVYGNRVDTQNLVPPGREAP